MPLEPTEGKIRRQIESLAALYPGNEDQLLAFLAEDLHPLDRESVLASVRDVALRLILTMTPDEARAELLKDRAKTQAFYSTVSALFPMLQRELRATPGLVKTEGPPFYELCAWMIEISGPA